MPFPDDSSRRRCCPKRSSTCTEAYKCQQRQCALTRTAYESLLINGVRITLTPRSTAFRARVVLQTIWPHTSPVDYSNLRSGRTSCRLERSPSRYVRRCRSWLLVLRRQEKRRLLRR